MMNLLADMDLKNIKIENLAKAKNDFEFCWPPSEDGGNSNGDNSNGGNSQMKAIQMETIQMETIQKQENF